MYTVAHNGDTQTLEGKHSWSHVTDSLFTLHV